MGEGYSNMIVSEIFIFTLLLLFINGSHLSEKISTDLYSGLGNFVNIY